RDGARERAHDPADVLRAGSRACHELPIVAESRSPKRRTRRRVTGEEPRRGPRSLSRTPLTRLTLSPMRPILACLGLLAAAGLSPGAQVRPDVDPRVAA